MKKNRNLTIIAILLLIVCATAFCLVSCDFSSVLSPNSDNVDNNDSSSSDDTSNNNDDSNSNNANNNTTNGDVINNNYDITVTTEAMGLRYAVAEVVESVVKVTAVLRKGTSQATVSGSGSIISSDGLVLTNRHVVNETGYTVESITVTAMDADYNETSYSAELVNFSGSFDLDIRVLKIKNANGKTFKPVSIAKSDSLKMGDTTFMLGNSASTGFTMSSAVVAHPKSTEFANSGYGFSQIVKINADVNHGNSGGGLFNLKGDLVGVVTYRKEGSSSSPSSMIQGIGYALRTEDILAIIESHYGTTVYNKIAIDTYDDIYKTTTEAA